METQPTHAHRTKEFLESIESLRYSSILDKKYTKHINIAVFKKHSKDIRKNATIDDLEFIDAIEGDIITHVRLGNLRTDEQIISAIQSY